MRLTAYLLIPVLLTSACVTEKVVCQVIKTADDVCVTIEMVTGDGQVQRVQVSGTELRQFGNERMAAHKQQDGGADAAPPAK